MDKKEEAKGKIKELFKEAVANLPPAFPNHKKFEGYMESSDYKKMRDAFLEIEQLDAYAQINAKYFLQNDEVLWEKKALVDASCRVRISIDEARKSIGKDVFVVDYFDKVVQWWKRVSDFADLLIEYTDSNEPDKKDD